MDEPAPAGMDEPAPAGMGPLTGRVAEPGGGVLRLSTAPAGAEPGAAGPAGAEPGAAGSPAAAAGGAAGTQASTTARSRTPASGDRPGKPMGWCPCSRRGPILMTGSAGTRRSLPRRGRDPGEPGRQ
jgi:hypothetical protein